MRILRICRGDLSFGFEKRNIVVPSTWFAVADVASPVPHMRGSFDTFLCCAVALVSWYFVDFSFR